MVSLFQRGDKPGHEKKLDKMLKEVFTRNSYSSCLHNMLTVFPPYSPYWKKNPKTQNQQKKKTHKKIPNNWLVFSLWFS